MPINDVQNCYPYTSATPYIYPTTYYYSSYVDGVKAEAMRLALEAKKGRPFKEIAKLATEIEAWLKS